MNVKVADEVWVATALLHRERPAEPDFNVREIVDRVAQENITGRLRPGVQVHISLHCVANKRPNPGNYRMLFETSRGRRRLFRPSDPFHSYREGGKTCPRPEDLPEQYLELLRWYENEYVRG
ncbi:MAG TPA: hypothetical protein VGK99_21900 [Acidobacteriota bacterium]|jgi:hypothetical protein